MNYSPRIERFGELQDSSGLEQRADEMKWAQAKNVRAFVGDLPQGVSLDGDKIKADPAQYEILGKVYTNFKPPYIFNTWFYDYPEDESGRKLYCHVQVPLAWITLTMWSYLPWTYPCQVVDSYNNPKDINARKFRIVNTLKKATAALGGNILVITSLGKLKTVSGTTGQELHTLDMIAAEGYALRSKKLAAASK